MAQTLTSEDIINALSTTIAERDHYKSALELAVRWIAETKQCPPGPSDAKCAVREGAFDNHEDFDAVGCCADCWRSRAIQESGDTIVWREEATPDADDR